MIRAALFDLDGVVLDTETQYTRFWGSELDRIHPGDGVALAKHIKGSTLIQIFDRYYAGNPAAQKAVEQRLYQFEDTMDYDYIPGFEHFVSLLHQQGVKTAIVTSSNLDKMRVAFRKQPKLKSYFNAVLTSEDFERSKPDPDCYLKAAAHLGFETSECVGFEDSINGLRALNAAHMRTIGLATTNPRNVVAHYADVVIDNYINVDPQQLMD